MFEAIFLHQFLKCDFDRARPTLIMQVLEYAIHFDFLQRKFGARNLESFSARRWIHEGQWQIVNYCALQEECRYYRKSCQMRRLKS